MPVRLKQCLLLVVLLSRSAIADSSGAEPIGAVESTPLRLAELEQMALAHHPAIASARAQIEAALGRQIQVGLRKNPVLTYQGSDIGELGGAGKQGGYFTQEIITAHKRRLARAETGAEIDQLTQELSTVESRVLGDVRMAYYAVIFAQRRRDLATRMLELGSINVDTVKKLHDALEVGKIDLWRAELERDETKILKMDAITRHDAVWRHMSAVVGQPDLRPTRLADEMLADVPQLEWESSLNLLLQQSPEIASAVMAVERAEWSQQLALAGRRPNIEFSAGVQTFDVAQETVANVEIGVPLPVFDRNQGTIREAEANLLAAQTEVALVRLNLQNRLAGAFQKYNSARQQAALYAEQIMPNAKKSLDLVHQGYQAGELDYVALLTAQRTLIRTSIRYQEAQEIVWRNHVLIDNFLLSGSLDAAGQSVQH